MTESENAAKELLKYIVRRKVSGKSLEVWERQFLSQYLPKEKKGMSDQFTSFSVGVNGTEYTFTRDLSGQGKHKHAIKNDGKVVVETTSWKELLAVLATSVVMGALAKN